MEVYNIGYLLGKICDNSVTSASNCDSSEDDV